MSNVVPHPTSHSIFSRAETLTIKKTVARGLTDTEFDQFIHMCKAMRLDPLRRQIYAIVTSAKDPNKRAVAYVTGIDGYRTIAARTGNYRPGKRSFVQDDTAKDPDMNPKGIVSATAIVHVYAHGEWYDVEETVYWSEMAPLREKWVNNKPTGAYYLDPKKRNWHVMPGIMLQKCAEAQALRRAWPEDFSGLYEESEIDVIDITPTEIVEEAEKADRMAKIGGPSITFGVMSDDGFEMKAIPVGQAFDWLDAWVRDHKDDQETVKAFRESNAESLRQFWGEDGGAALEIRKRMDAVRDGDYDDQFGTK